MKTEENFLKEKLNLSFVFDTDIETTKITTDKFKKIDKSTCIMYNLKLIEVQKKSKAKNENLENIKNIPYLKFMQTLFEKFQYNLINDINRLDAKKSPNYFAVKTIFAFKSLNIYDLSSYKNSTFKQKARFFKLLRDSIFYLRFTQSKKYFNYDN